MPLWVRWFCFEILLNEGFVGFGVLLLFFEKRLVFFGSFVWEKRNIELLVEILGFTCNILCRWRGSRRNFSFNNLRFLVLFFILQMLLRFLIIITIIINLIVDCWTLFNIKDGILLGQNLLILWTLNFL